MANLHLVVNEEIKQQVKDIAKARGMNLSTLVEAYFVKLVLEQRGIELASELLEVEPLQAPASDDKARESYLDRKYGVRGSSAPLPEDHSKVITTAASVEPSADTAT